MLNLKKGLAVALAAATALTFAPVSAFAGTTLTSTGSGDSAETLKTTMNTNANVWSYDETLGTAATAHTPADENTAVVVLTPSNPDGSVTFTKAVTTGTTYADGTWFDLSTRAETVTNTGAKDIQLTASKNSKTLAIKANVATLRALTQPESIEIEEKSSSGISAASLEQGAKVTVILAPHAVQMNNHKVTLSTAGDSAHDRYTTHGDDVYDSYEARPDSVAGTTNKDIKTTDNNNVALDGQRISQITMNLADASKDKTFKVETNADVTYKSDDSTIATIDKDGIHAKAVGETNVSITTKQSLTAYGEVTVTIPVKVINKQKATLSGPDDLYIHGYNTANAVKIGVTGTNIEKNSIIYDFVYWDAASQTWVAFGKSATNETKPTKTNSLNPYVMDKTSDSVYVESYTGDDQDKYNWGAYLRATATPADGYTAPDPKFIRLHFDNSAPFVLDSNSQTLHVGESVQITAQTTRVATGAAFAYKSWNPAVATVSSTGAITAVGEGSTKIDVSYGGYTQSVAVTVKEYENGKNSDGTPVQVTGVTVSNKKGAAVKVTFDKSSIKNVKYYVQKKVSGKTSGKSVGSNKTTLSVKKGATVKVRVKAYYYDANGNKLVGSYSAWKSLKTDKK